MTYIVKEPRLEWVSLLANCINSATENIKKFSFPRIQNLHTTVTFLLKEPFTNKDIPLVRSLINSFARSNDCVIKEISFSDEKLTLLVYLKYKNGLSRNDPMEADRYEKRKRGENKMG